MKLESIEGMSTNWTGLWWHPEYNGFSSAVIDLSELRKFKGKIRMLMRKNKFYNGGENNRPNYNFCLKDADSPVFETLEVSEDEEDLFTKIEKLREIMRAGNANADVLRLPSESRAEAAALMQEAISLVEDITGEKWEFSFLSF